MRHSILIIDDIHIQAVNLQKVFKKERKYYFAQTATTEEEIENAISEFYFNIAIVDLRMDAFKFNGFEIIKNIIKNNPFAKIIIQSAYLPEYSEDLKDILISGKISAILDKGKFDKFKMQVLEETDKIVSEFEENPNTNQKALEAIYAEAKNEPDTYLKGTKFEQFISILFAQLGFNNISKRVKDKSLNEVDLIVRNEIDDTFFIKFSPYFLIECKNIAGKVDKNNFIVFFNKLDNTNGLANLGFLITSSSISWNTYIEAVRTSKTNSKIVFISNIEINKLIYSKDMLESFKQIIDEQVKDN